MRVVNYVILACFTAALGQRAGAPRLLVGAHSNDKIAIQCVSAITEFCLIPQYRSYMPQTIVYMNDCLLAFHQSKHIFAKFRDNPKVFHRDHESSSQSPKGCL